MFEEKIAALNGQYEEKMAVENKPFEKRTYTVDEIQDILGISRASAYNLVKRTFPLCTHWLHYPHFEEKF